MKTIEVPTPTSITAVSEEDIYGLKYRVEFAGMAPIIVGGKAVHQTMFGLVYVLDENDEASAICLNRIIVGSLIQRQTEFGSGNLPAEVRILSESEAGEVYRKFGVPTDELPEGAIERG